MSEQNIYSWISPIAKIRFEHPGEVNYILPDKTEKIGMMQSKDQYMIVNGKIIYLSTETLDNPRELIYQDYFSNQKKSFQNIQQLNRPESPHSFDLNTLEKLKLMGICLDVLDRNNINIMCYFDLNSNKTTKYSPFNTITGNTVLNNKHFSLDWLTDIIKTFRRWVVKIFA